MTMQQAAQQALDVQDACNLSGVLGAFRAVVFDVLWPAAREQGQGTEWVNQHPICTLFLDKLSDLNRRANEDAITLHRVFDQVEALAKAGQEVKAA